MKAGHLALKEFQHFTANVSIARIVLHGLRAALTVHQHMKPGFVLHKHIQQGGSKAQAEISLMMAAPMSSTAAAVAAW